MMWSLSNHTVTCTGPYFSKSPNHPPTSATGPQVQHLPRNWSTTPNHSKLKPSSHIPQNDSAILFTRKDNLMSNRPFRSIHVAKHAVSCIKGRILLSLCYITYLYLQVFLRQGFWYLKNEIPNHFAAWSSGPFPRKGQPWETGHNRAKLLHFHNLSARKHWKALWKQRLFKFLRVEMKIWKSNFQLFWTREVGHPTKASNN